ncbi:MAG: four-carbon acid sugar kinase family protein [Betaproteobacteria bacterium]
MTVAPDAGAGPLLGWYGDDFTGATDTLAALAHARLRALLFMGVPTPAQLAAAGPLEAVGIAGAARAMSPAAMLAELEPVGRFFAGLHVPVLHYKVCSTFDSAPGIGSIGAAIRTLRPHVANAFVPIVGGQPNIGRYCAFGTLFAVAGLGGVVHRIDRHPTMSRHPVTPMHEADLRVHLAAQGLPEIGAIHYPAYDAGAVAQDALLDAELARIAKRADSDVQARADIDVQARADVDVQARADSDVRAVLFDVAHVSHLAAVGRSIWQHARHRRLLAVGSSSVVQALAAHLNESDRAATAFSIPALAPAIGPVFVLSGSMSPVTATQIDAAIGYERLPADVSRLVGDAGYADQLVERITAGLRAQRNVLVCTTVPGGAAPDATAARHIAQATAALAARVIHQMVPIAPLRRIGIAGGDTSSHVVQALGVWGLSYQTTMAPGVTLSRAHSDSPALNGLELMLKGGQMGDTDLFGRLVTGGQDGRKTSRD